MSCSIIEHEKLCITSGPVHPSKNQISLAQIQADLSLNQAYREFSWFYQALTQMFSCIFRFQEIAGGFESSLFSAFNRNTGMKPNIVCI